MKVVLFCGGFGMRLREYSESIPKPMVPIGYRPVLWHVMKYYAHFGHKDFILCLGWQANVIKEYFLNYSEAISNDFVLSGGKSVTLLKSDIQDWKITFVDTGTVSNIGQRLRAVQSHLRGERTFLANYADGLTDMPLPRMIESHKSSGALATFMAVKPSHSFHAVTTDDQGRVQRIEEIAKSDVWMNAGNFVLDRGIFDYLHEGEELVYQPFTRLIELGRLNAVKYDGFFGCMDTYKEKQQLDDLHRRGSAPWELWKRGELPESRSGAPMVAPSVSIPTAGLPLVL